MSNKFLNGPPWTRTKNAEATVLRTAALPIPLTDPNIYY